MAGGLPYYKMYPKDFDADGKVRAMNDEQRGLFIRCLNYSWLNDGLPADVTEIQIAMSDPAKVFARKWPRVEPCFPIAEDGMRRNPRQEQERAKAKLKSEHNTKAIRSRYERRTNESLRAYGSVSVSEIETTEMLKIEKDERFQKFRDAYLATGKPLIDSDFQEARFEWDRLDFHQQTDALDGLAARIAASDDPQFIPLPKNYLAKKEWQRKRIAPRAANEGLAYLQS